MASTASFPIAAALLVGALLAGCGGSSGQSVSHQGLHRASDGAACGRASSDLTTPAVRTAARKCGHQDELPAAEARSRIAFVHCVRTHGVRNFPYPTAQGRVSVEMVRARGIDPQSPALARAVSACLPPSLRPPTTP